MLQINGAVSLPHLSSWHCVSAKERKCINWIEITWRIHLPFAFEIPEFWFYLKLVLWPYEWPKKFSKYYSLTMCFFKEHHIVSWRMFFRTVVWYLSVRICCLIFHLFNNIPFTARFCSSLLVTAGSSIFSEPNLLKVRVGGCPHAVPVPEGFQSLPGLFSAFL